MGVLSGGREQKGPGDQAEERGSPVTGAVEQDTYPRAGYWKAGSRTFLITSNCWQARVRQVTGGVAEVSEQVSVGHQRAPSDFGGTEALLHLSSSKIVN